MNYTEKSRVAYNKKAADYENTFDGRFTRKYRETMAGLVALKDGDCILDVACGNGSLLRLLTEDKIVAAYGTDISEEMIRCARMNYTDAVFSVGNADKLGFEDGRFDVVTCCCAFHHFDRPDLFLKEAYRVCTDGGKLYIGEINLPEFAMGAANKAVCFSPSGDVRIYSMDELAYLMHSAGFDKISVYRKGIVQIAVGTKIIKSEVSSDEIH